LTDNGQYEGFRGVWQKSSIYMFQPTAVENLRVYSPSTWDFILQLGHWIHSPHYSRAF